MNIPGHIVQLKTQIYELEKGQQNNENKTKLERLKEISDIQPGARTVLTGSECEIPSHIYKKKKVAL